ncbi:MAG: hypothetical protein WCK49_04950 [Myxococcaceae bacterium]
MLRIIYVFFVFLVSQSSFATKLPFQDSGCAFQVFDASNDSEGDSLPSLSSESATYYQVFVGQNAGGNQREAHRRLLRLLQRLGFNPQFIERGQFNTFYVGLATIEERDRLLTYHRTIFAQRAGTFAIFQQNMDEFGQDRDLGPEQAMGFELPRNHQEVTRARLPLPRPTRTQVAAVPVVQQLFQVVVHNFYILNGGDFVRFLNANGYYPTVRLEDQTGTRFVLFFTYRVTAERFLNWYEQLEREFQSRSQFQHQPYAGLGGFGGSNPSGFFY